MNSAPLRKRDSHLWARDPLDWYVEPPWCSERLFAVEPFDNFIIDPAAGRGNIVASARAAGYPARGEDIVDRGAGFPQRDFLKTPIIGGDIVSNPPFGIAERFARHALVVAAQKVALLLPTKWIQGDKRSRWLEDTPLRRVWFLAPRPSMPPGTVIAAGEKPGNGTTDYAWFIWEKDYSGRPEIAWLRRQAGEKARDLLRDIQLTEDQRLVLGVLGREFNTGPYYGNTYLTFAGIEARLETTIGKQRVRLACRALTRQGLACFRNGLWDDEGPAGSGYAATPDGALVALAIEDSERSGAAGTGESQGATE